MSGDLLVSVVSEEKIVGCNAPSRTRSNLEEVFGKMPIELDMGDLEKLEIMALMEKDKINPYRTLANKLEKCERILVRFAY